MTAVVGGGIEKREVVEGICLWVACLVEVRVKSAQGEGVAGWEGGGGAEQADGEFLVVAEVWRVGKKEGASGRAGAVGADEEGTG